MRTNANADDRRSPRPLLMLDIDGVFSLFGFAADRRPDGTFHAVEGIVHFLSASAARHLQELGEHFEPVWCSGWEEKANEHLPHLLGLPGPLPYLRFERKVGRTRAHWKLDAIDAYALARPLAWVDDAFNEACERWASERPAPTLLLRTRPDVGLDDDGVRQLLRFASAIASGDGHAHDRRDTRGQTSRGGATDDAVVDAG